MYIHGNNEYTLYLLSLSVILITVGAPAMTRSVVVKTVIWKDAVSISSTRSSSVILNVKHWGVLELAGNVNIVVVDITKSDTVENYNKQ